MKSLLLLLACTSTLCADVRLPSFISDHMVLQQDLATNVWGWADAGEKVSVKLGGKTAEAKADDRGKWSVKLEELPPGGPHELVISGKNTVTIKDVLVGEVWLASGQSNMGLNVKDAANPEQEIAACNFPELRVFIVPGSGRKEPLEEVAGQWVIATPQSAPRFTAAGYFFARELHQKLKVPVGLIQATWGGTPIETWMPEIAFKANPAFSEHWQKRLDAYPQAKAAFDEATAKWKADAEQAKAEGKPVPSAPGIPYGPETPHAAPMGLFNGMIAPVTPYTLRGAVWYQGESNAGRNNLGNMPLYGQLFASMILSWRYEFARAQNLPRDQCEFPVLFVQLTNFAAQRAEPADSHWAQIREAQRHTLEVPRTGMAVTIDIGDAVDIHPKNKQEVGRRLALNALAEVYFQEIECSGPLYSGFQDEDKTLRLSFSHAEGMKSRDGGPIKGFALAGEDKKFVWAEAVIEGDHVIVSSPKVPNPVAVRYAWADNPDCNLINAAGLPASPFRSDNWPQETPAGSAGD